MNANKHHRRPKRSERKETHFFLSLIEIVQRTILLETFSHTYLTFRFRLPYTHSLADATRNESGNAVSRQHNFGLSCTRLDTSNGRFTRRSIVWIDWKTIGMCSWQRRFNAHVCTEFLWWQWYRWCTGKLSSDQCVYAVLRAQAIVVSGRPLWHVCLHRTSDYRHHYSQFDKSHLIAFNKIELDVWRSRRFFRIPFPRERHWANFEIDCM